MTHSVVWLEQADADLDAIYQWIALRADPETALRFVLRIEAATTKLAEFPDRGRPRTTIAPDLRSIPFARTMTIFYTVAASSVRIVRVLHARRDTPGAFDEGDPVA